jgi:imidazolonepropionase-like amidohydrolase
MNYIFARHAITGDGKTVLSPAYIGIDEEKIALVSDVKPSNSSPDNTVSFNDATVIPGLLNIHDHICRKIIREPSEKESFGSRLLQLMSQEESYLALHSAHNMRNYLLKEGITWVRDYGLGGGTSFSLKRAISEGIAVGPEIDTCGTPIAMTGGHCYRQAYIADGVPGIMQAVRIQAQRGATIIKFMGSGGLEHFPKEEPTSPQYTVEELTAGVAVARDLGLPTAIHAYAHEAIERAIATGIENIEHGALMSEDQVERIAKKGINFNPTMSGLRYAFSTGPNRKYWDILTERIFSKQENAMRIAKAAGVLIGAGTDSGGWLYDEIALIGKTLEENPVEALTHATSVNAKIARRPDIGLLEAGRRADIAVFSGDLSVSLEPLKTGLIAVWKQGTRCL